MLKPNYPIKGIDKRRHRATKLGVDDLICNVFFEAGLRNYASWSRDPDWACPSISEVRESQGGCLGFTLKGRRYSIRAEEDHSHPLPNPNTTRIHLELLLGGNLVFGAAIEHQTIKGLDSYSLKSVTEFIEGDWIEDLRDLGREMKQVAKRNLKRIKRERAQKDASTSTLSTLRRIWRTMVAGRH